MKKGKWRTRTRGTRGQIGKKFQLQRDSQQKLKSLLPKISKKGHIVTVKHPEKTVKLAMKKVSTSQLVPRESNPVDLDRRANYFVDQIQRGNTIPPVLVHKLPDGRYEIVDGHARVEAYKRLGITEIPAVDNSILESLGKGVRTAGRIVVGGARLGKKIAKIGYREGKTFAKATEETLSQAGRIRRAYRGEISPREELEHEERLAEIRAGRRQEPRVREIVREVNVPFGGSSSPLLSKPMREEVRKARWRKKRKAKKS